MSTSKLEKSSPSTHDAAVVPEKTSPAVEKLEKLRKSYTIAGIERLVAQGKKAIWGGNSWEAPLIYACDTIPVAMNELWRYESRAAESVGENYFQIPPEFCSMIKAMIGRLHLRAPDPINKILYFGSCCEPIVNVLELAKIDNYDVYCIENITSFKTEDKRPEVLAFLVRELQGVILWLNKGKPLDEEKLWTEIKRKNLVSQKIRTILDLRLKAPLYLSSISTMQVILGANHYFGQPEKYIALLDMLIDELTVAAHTHEDRYFIPIVFAGGGGGGMGILKVIEESHGAVVGWVVAGTEDYRLDVPPLESIAHYLLDAQIRGELGEGAGTSATYRKYRVEELIKKNHAKGVISLSITGCPYGSVVQKNERDYFQSLGIPIITLESNVHNERPAEEQIMRVKAFFEMFRN
ncbi:MAG TPA: 2-hydroxyacyl-CoA dehydratase family protein [Negativicutes bacterium]